MARPIAADLADALSAQVVHPFMAVSIDFGGGSITRAWSGYGDLTIDGHTYTGVGLLGTISALPETSETKAVGVKLELSGVPLDSAAAALNANYQGRPVSIYIGALDDAHAIIATPYKVFGGQIDTMQLNTGQDSARISVAVESRLIDMERVRESRYTHEEQQRRFPGDRGFEYVAGMQEKEVVWGR